MVEHLPGVLLDYIDFFEDGLFSGFSFALASLFIRGGLFVGYVSHALTVPQLVLILLHLRAQTVHSFDLHDSLTLLARITHLAEVVLLESSV